MADKKQDNEFNNKSEEQVTTPGIGGTTFQVVLDEEWFDRGSKDSVYILNEVLKVYKGEEKLYVPTSPKILKSAKTDYIISITYWQGMFTVAVPVLVNRKKDTWIYTFDEKDFKKTFKAVQVEVIPSYIVRQINPKLFK